MKIYEALYNSMTEESSYETISIHKKRQGARDALAKKVKKEREKFNKRYNYNRNEMPYIFGDFEEWDVIETDLLE